MLGVSPSAVSKNIQRLEEHLHLLLFHRTTRSLTLTSEGREVFERALRLLKEAEGIEQVAAASNAEPSGVLRVTAPLPIGVHVIAPALPRLRRLYPKLAFDLRLSDQLVDLVADGIDVAVRIGEPTDSRLRARRLGTHTYSAFASPGYLQRMGVPRHPEELARHECINFRYQSSGQVMQWLFKTSDRSVELTPDAAAVVNMGEAVTRILVADGGIGMCAHYAVAEWVQAGRLVPVLTEFSVTQAAVTALWPESRVGSPNVKAFVEFLAQQFSDHALRGPMFPGHELGRS